MYGKYRFLRPWVLGALVWFFVSYAVLSEYQKSRPPGPGYQRELWFLLSLLWLQFGFAGIFQAVKRGRAYQIIAFVLLAILPPLLLYLSL